MEVELGQLVQSNIYQSNTYRKNLNCWLHFDENGEPSV